MNSVKLPYLSLLEDSFKKNLKIITYSGAKILIVTKADEVYRIGPLLNRDSDPDYLGKRIPELDGKKVKKFCFGYNFIAALTQNGEAYSWGENGSCQLGQGHEDSVDVPTKISSLAEKNVVDIVCGYSHMVVLCDDNTVYCWGWGNKMGSSQTHVATNAVAIASSKEAAFYLSTDGEVFGISYLTSKPASQYHIGNGPANDYYRTWTKIDRLSRVEKIVCGDWHALALDTDGILFFWGNSPCDSSTQVYPVPFLSIPEKITDIAAIWMSGLCAVMTESSSIYVWGGSKGEYQFSKPFLTSFKSFNEVFTNFCNPNTTYDCENVGEAETNTVEGLESIFDKQEDSDLEMVVGGKSVFVHKLILKTFSKYFQEKFAEETEMKVLEITGYSYDSFRRYLLYLYVGKIDVTSKNNFELLRIAHDYSDDALLQLIRKKITKYSDAQGINKVIKEMSKLSPQDYKQFCDEIKKPTN